MVLRADQATVKETRKDLTMAANVYLERYKRIGGTRLCAMAIKACNEMIAEGYLDGLSVHPVVNSDQAIAAHDKDTHRLVGLLIFRNDEDREISVGLGYVVPDHRRRGIYRMMWNELIQFAQENKLERIYSSTNVKNEPMIAFSKKAGRTLRSYNYVFYVPPEEEKSNEKASAVSSLPGEP